MSTTVTLPEGFHYLAPAFVSTIFLLYGQNITVSQYRKRAGIAYPQMYAEKKQAEDSKDAHLFNCAQRAHQNTLENIPIVYTATLVAGLKYPVFAAASLAFWSLSRVSYTRGYITGDPKKRGSILYIAGAVASLGVIGLATFISGSWLYEGLAAKFF
ncbi:membrane-associated proteins in eicosanoid and glutathione metabolism [Pholiota conissans]|uniref:Membrane-associated proteins in eicosanoid and glutathione metabolism n=1 Tax=Pholiota conissans TaxID=109636 RepID=A0A9P5YXX3_9AGAR|nr:membrane-associated proteins in eicosanoid and glutathione metabolism [Pholiota conissans]